MATSKAQAAGTALTEQVPAGCAAVPLPDLRTERALARPLRRMTSGLSLCYSNSLSVTWSQYVSVSCGTCKMGAPRRQVSLLSSTPAAPSSHLYTWLVFNTCYLFIYFYYYSWHIIVSVYNMVTWHLSDLWSDHHYKSSNCHLTKLLHDWLYFLCFRLHTPWLMYFITRSLYLLIFTFFTLPLSLPCWRPSVLCIYISVLFCLFICFTFQIPHINEILQYLSLSCS